MPFDPQAIPAEDTARYRIRVYGYLDAQASSFWNGMVVTREKDADGLDISTLDGQLPNQAALASVLNTLYDLGFALLSVECLSGKTQ
jgi:hypothetical protein